MRAMSMHFLSGFLIFYTASVVATIMLGGEISVVDFKIAFSGACGLCFGVNYARTYGDKS